MPARVAGKVYWMCCLPPSHVIFNPKDMLRARIYCLLSSVLLMSLHSCTPTVWTRTGRCDTDRGLRALQLSVMLEGHKVNILEVVWKAWERAAPWSLTEIWPVSWRMKQRRTRRVCVLTLMRGATARPSRVNHLLSCRFVVTLSLSCPCVVFFFFPPSVTSWSKHNATVTVVPLI